jgi:hypothetical protein
MSDQNALIGGIDYKLSGSGITSTATSVTVDDLQFPDGTAITMAMFGGVLGYATLEPRVKSKKEFISFSGITNNGDGTSTLTGVTRGLKPYTPFTADTTIRYSHAGATTLIFSNPPQVYERYAAKNNDETIVGAWTFEGGAVTFDSSNIPIFDNQPTLTNDKQVATKKYADDLAIAGSPNASTTVKGIVEIATEAQSLAGTDTGETTAPLSVLPSQIAKNIQNTVYNYAADAGANDTYAITIAPAISAYATGQIFTFKANTVNTGAATLNVNTKGAIAIKKNKSQALEDGDIAAGMFVTVVYDGTNFQMVNQQATIPSTAVLGTLTTIAGYTNLGEADTFFASTDITAAEAQTLTAGATSDAGALHNHLQHSLIQDSIFEFIGSKNDGLTAGGTVSRGFISSSVPNDGGSLKSSAAGSTGLEIDWDNKFVFQTVVKELQASANDTIADIGLLETGTTYSNSEGTLTAKHALFLHSMSAGTGEQYWASNGNGTTQTRTDITASLSMASWVILKIDYLTTAGHIKYYVNGALVADHTTNLPTAGTPLMTWYFVRTGSGELGLLNNYVLKYLN